MTTIWSRHGLTLAWRNDEFGNTDRALYMGGIYVGGLTREKLKFAIGGTNPEPRDKQWRTWMMDSEGGNPVGYFLAEQEARDALVDVVLKALFGEAET